MATFGGKLGILYSPQCPPLFIVRKKGQELDAIRAIPSPW
jgi:hypothetical protein